MKKLTLVAAFVAMAGLASAAILIPDGDFEQADHVPYWTFASAGPGLTYNTSGGNGGGYASIDATAGEWAVLVAPPEPGNAGGGIPISYFGGAVVAGSTSTFTIDLKTLSGTAAGGMKVEAWAGNALLGFEPDNLAPSASATWQTHTFDWLVPAGTEKLIFVPVWGANSDIGYDNVGVVPEPATFGLLGLAGAALFVVRRFRG